MRNHSKFSVENGDDPIGLRALGESLHFTFSTESCSPNSGISAGEVANKVGGLEAFKIGQTIVSFTSSITKFKETVALAWLHLLPNYSTHQVVFPWIVEHEKQELVSSGNVFGGNQSCTVTWSQLKVAQFFQHNIESPVFVK